MDLKCTHIYQIHALLGRGQITGIHDVQLSRKQLQVQLNNNGSVTIKCVCGLNSAHIIDYGINVVSFRLE